MTDDNQNVYGLSIGRQNTIINNGSMIINNDFNLKQKKLEH